MTAALLPPNSTPLERAAADAVGARFDLAVPVRDLWSPERCPAPLLPWLAWALSVDVWRDDWSVEVKRRVIGQSVSVHRSKGSRASIERAIAAMGIGEVIIVEGVGTLLYDGSVLHDGTEEYGTPSHWADYRVFARRPISNTQADSIRAALAATQPVRCRLVELIFAEALIYDGGAVFDGTYNHGVA